MKKLVLMILDGWGKGHHDQADAISEANPEYMNGLLAKYLNSELSASGEDVGLPAGQMGNSEVGHLTLGAGRVMYQDLVRINKEVASENIFNNAILIQAFEYAKANGKQVHLISLLGSGGVHALSSHLLKIVEMATKKGLEKVFVHGLTDGRDTDPKSGIGFVKEVLAGLAKTHAKLATLIGRYYTMDRDKRWERIKEGYDLMVNGVGEKTTDFVKALEDSYAAGVTDEFFKAHVAVDDVGSPVTKIADGDVVICVNFRTDRLRQITTALSQQDFPEFGMNKLNLEYLTMTRYDDGFQGVKVIYDKENLQETMGEVVAKSGLKQLRIAETEKYPHVTFFFSGGQESSFEGEERVIVPSPKVATYDLQPEMSALEVADKVVEAINSHKFDFICLNFANADMVGHTGVKEAIIKAIKATDQAVGKVVDAAKANDYAVLITADHGNSDCSVNEDGSPNTAHSLNPVPLIAVVDGYAKLENGTLADVAPTALKIMGLPVPAAMTGKILIQ